MIKRVEMSITHGDTFHIPYTSRDFPSEIDSSGHLETSWDDLLGAALTVGRPNTAYVFAHGDPSYHEALFRLSLVRMAVEQRSYFRHDALEFHWRDPDPETCAEEDGIELIHDAILSLLRAGDWAAARRRAEELEAALQERGFRADGLKVVAGESWQRKHEPMTRRTEGPR